MPVVRIARAANEDLVEIWGYVAQINREAAVGLIKDFWIKFEILSRNPKIGRIRREFSPDLRSLPIKNYVVFYRPVDNGIEVIRILHGSRDIERIFEEFIDFR
jgi:toxin ParE1/3/4